MENNVQYEVGDLVRVQLTPERRRQLSGAGWMGENLTKLDGLICQVNGILGVQNDDPRLRTYNIMNNFIQVRAGCQYTDISLVAKWSSESEKVEIVADNAGKQKQNENNSAQTNEQLELF